VILGVVLLVVVGIGVGVGVGLYLKNKNSGNGSGNIPYVTPPVATACPSGLKGGLAGQGTPFQTQTLDPQQIIDRFFNPAGGPTNLFRILSDVDQRIQSINDRFDQFSGFMSNSPVSYSLNTASWAASPTFYAQCSVVWGVGSGFDQWGQVGATTYLYVRGGDSIVAAQLVGNGTFGNIQSVSIWYSVGVINRNGSHSVAMVYAVPSELIFEMSVAGVNVGFCGAQMKSDGVVLNVTGSADGPGCAAVDSSCTQAASLATPTTCNSAVDTFYLPALGRQAYASFAASAYPGGVLNTVTLANSGPDDTFFGPSSPTV